MKKEHKDQNCEFGKKLSIEGAFIPHSLVSEVLGKQIL